MKGQTRGALTLYTVGFTKTTAEAFFEKLRGAEVQTVLDVRLHRDGQLSGFAKVPDLPYFLRRLCASGYEPLTSFAPTDALLKSYREKRLSWGEYAEAYQNLLAERRPERDLEPALLDRACLLCSEHTAERCHRRLAAEYLRDSFAPAARIEIVHL